MTYCIKAYKYIIRFLHTFIRIPVSAMDTAKVVCIFYSAVNYKFGLQNALRFHNFKEKYTYINAILDCKEKDGWDCVKLDFKDYF